MPHKQDEQPPKRQLTVRVSERLYQGLQAYRQHREQASRLSVSTQEAAAELLSEALNTWVLHTDGASSFVTAQTRSTKARGRNARHP